MTLGRFKPGDRVRVINKISKYYGREFTITSPLKKQFTAWRGRYDSWWGYDVAESKTYRPVEARLEFAYECEPL